MNSKLSDRLQQRIKVASSDEEIDVTVLLKSNLSEELVENAILYLENLGAKSIHYIPASASLHCRALTKTTDEIVSFDAVEYVDIESTADINELLDD